MSTDPAGHGTRPGTDPDAVLQYYAVSDQYSPHGSPAGVLLQENRPDGSIAYHQFGRGLHWHHSHITTDPGTGRPVPAPGIPSSYTAITPEESEAITARMMAAAARADDRPQDPEARL